MFGDGEWGAVWSSELEGAVGEAFDVEAAFVDSVMVVHTQERHVRKVGGAAVDPVDEVVGVGPAGGEVAAGERAAAVACGEGPADAVGRFHLGDRVADDDVQPGGAIQQSSLMKLHILRHR